MVKDSGMKTKSSGSKSNKKSEKKNAKYGSKSKKVNTKKTVSGSKTLRPSKKIDEQDTAEENTMDVNEIFDIIKSETKQKGNIIFKETRDVEAPKLKSKMIIEDEEEEEAMDQSKIPQMIMTNDPMGKNAIKSYMEAKKFLKDHNISISTITLDCKLHTLIDVDKFAKNVTLKEDEIVSVKFGNRKDSATNRTIVVIKSKKKPSTKNFYNQVTILMKPTNNPTRNYINIKVFKNGSLQMTGCKDMDDFNNVTTTLIKILKRGRNIKGKNGKTTHIDFIDSPKQIGMFDVKIRMINSNFKLDYKVDRKKLARLLKKNHRKNTKDKDIGYVECKYDPAGGHSCVNIKHRYDDKSKPSIFVFQTGAIIITGAKNLNHIIAAYHFIHRILNKYYDEIKIIDLDQKSVKAEIAKFFKDKKKKSTNAILEQ